MKLKFISFLAIALIASIVPVRAQDLGSVPHCARQTAFVWSDNDSLILRSSIEWSGMIEFDFADDGLVLGLMEAGLVILNISDPAGPRELSKLYIPGGGFTDIRVSGDFACITAGNGSNGLLYVINASDACHPFLAGVHEIPAPANGVDVLGSSAALVAYGSDIDTSGKGLMVLDFSNPDSMDVLGSIDTDFRLLEVRAGSDRYAYAVGGARVLVIDLLLARVVTEYYTGFFPVNLEFNKERVFIADLDMFTPPIQSAMTILEVVDDTALSLVGRCRLSGSVADVSASSGKACAANGSRGVQIIDITDPASPDIVGNYPTIGKARRVAMNGSLMFVTDRPASSDSGSGAKPGDFQIVDVSSEPSLVGVHPAHGAVTKVVSSSGVYRTSRFAYLLNNTGIGKPVKVVDVSDRSKPHVVGTTETIGKPQDAVLNDTLLLVGTSHGLELVNVADKTSPVPMGSLPVSSGIIDLELKDGRVYAACGSNGLLVIDPDPGNLRVTGSVNTEGLAASVAVLNGYAYVSWVKLPYSGISIFDVSGAGDPIYVSTFGIQGHIYNTRIVSDGGHLYAKTPDGFHVFSIGDDPESPEYVTEFYTGIGITDFVLVGDYMMIANGGEGAWVVRVAEPAKPELVYAYDTPGAAAGVAVDCTSVYVADWWDFTVLGHPILTDVPEEPVLPEDFVLYQNYPNPFNPTTTIEFFVRQRCHVVLAVYNVLGQEVATLVNGRKPEGMQSVRWDASGRASGVYFCRLDAGSFTETRKMMFVK
jgi:hypothetical protein